MSVSLKWLLFQVEQLVLQRAKYIQNGFVSEVELYFQKESCLLRTLNIKGGSDGV